METKTLAKWTENVTSIATPKGQLGIISLVKDDIVQEGESKRERGGKERDAGTTER